MERFGEEASNAKGFSQTGIGFLKVIVSKFTSRKYGVGAGVSVVRGEEDAIVVVVVIVVVAVAVVEATNKVVVEDDEVMLLRTSVGKGS